jgi:protein-S-isoprenylcysteine O-methyltransferase Ste14
MNRKLLLKATIAALVVPGTVVLLLPYFILHQTGPIEWPKFSGQAILASTTGLIGLGVLLHCIRGFATFGKGTLAPIDPPKILVVRGLYKFTRNPMYLAVVVVLLSESWLFKSFTLLIYGVAVFLVFHLFVTLYEEPRLHALFGESYEEYSKSVPRWRVKLAGFKSGNRRNESSD